MPNKDAVRNRSRNKNDIADRPGCLIAITVVADIIVMLLLLL